MSAPFAFPAHVEEALVTHDWRLRVYWNGKLNRWEILRLKKGHAAHPTNYIPHVCMGRDARYWCVRYCVDEKGNPRSPEMGDYHHLRAGDTQNMRPKDVLAAMKEDQTAEARADAKRVWDAMEAGGKELFAKLALGRTQVGYGP